MVTDISDDYMVYIYDNILELFIYYRHTMRVTLENHQEASDSHPKHVAMSVIYYM